MKSLANYCSSVALAALLAGQAMAAEPTIEVRPSPIHAIPDTDDAAPAAPVPSATPAVAVLQSAPTVNVDAAPAVAPAMTGPSVEIARRIVDAAGAFDAYMRRASSISPAFGGGDAVAKALTLGATYEPGQLEEGAVAYSALAALQDPAFVAVVREVAAHPAAREAFAARLVTQPEAVLDAPAARRAAVTVAVALGRRGAALLAAGAAVKQAAYDVQHQDWSRQPIVGPAARLARIKTESMTPVSLTSDDTAALIAGLGRSSDVAGPQVVATAASPVVVHGLALAALAILGKAGDDQAGELAPLLAADASQRQCIKMARLNLYQCLSVAGPHYEDVFCLGRHAMMDTAQCIVSAAGVTPMQVVAEPIAPRAPGGTLVPVALTVAEGPEAAGVYGPRILPEAPPPPVAVSDAVAIPIALAAPAKPPGQLASNP